MTQNAWNMQSVGQRPPVTITATTAHVDCLELWCMFVPDSRSG